MIRKYQALLAAAFCAFAAAPALADGMYSIKDAPAACCEAKWSGLYIGAAVGYGIGRHDTNYQVDSVQWAGNPDTGQDLATQFFGDTTTDVTSEGVQGTITVGYDRDIGRNVVIGIFADYTFGSLDGDFVSEYQQTIDSRPFGADHTFNIDDQWSIGARIGLARSCCTLWYVAAGYTQADLEVEDHRARNPGELPIGTRSSNLSGYFIGAGVEQQLHGGLSLKLEYRFSDLGSDNVYDVTQNFQCDTANCGVNDGIKRTERLDIDSDIHSIRLGLAYKFDFHRPAPVEPLK